MTTYVTFHFYVIFEVKFVKNRTVRDYICDFFESSKKHALQYNRAYQYFEELPDQYFRYNCSD